MDIKGILFTTRGASKAVAEQLGISSAAVSQWRTRGIPPGRLADVQRIVEGIARPRIDASEPRAVS